MRGKDLLDKMDLIDSRYIENDNTVIFKSKKSITKPIIGIAACIMIIISAAIVIGTQSNNITKDFESNSEVTTTIESYRIPTWEEKSIFERYSSCNFNNKEYTTRSAVLAPENIGDKLTTITLQGYDIYTDKNYSSTADIYEIKNISSEAAIGVTLSDGNIYAYTCGDYVPETLEDFISAIDLNNTLSIGSVYDERNPLQPIVYENISLELIKNILFANTKLINEAYSSVGATIMSISVNVEILGYKNLSLNLTEDGYMWTNLLESGKYFYIGNEVIDKFINEVTENNQGDIYTYNTSVENTEE